MLLLREHISIEHNSYRHSLLLRYINHSNTPLKEDIQLCSALEVEILLKFIDSAFGNIKDCDASHNEVVLNSRS